MAVAAVQAPRTSSKTESFVDNKSKDDIRQQNIVTARVVADAVRTSLGPKGMDKMIQTASGEVIITNDGVTILNKMEHIVHSMKDPSIAAFWLITMPQIVGGFNFDDEVKQKIWWQYKESMRYDQLRDVVAQRKPGWEHLQEGLIALDPVRAREDPVVVKNIPYYKAKKLIEAEILKLSPPPRPQNWGELKLPLDESSWTEVDLKDPRKLYEMTVLLNAQREIAEKILDTQWEAKWRQDKINEMLEEKVRPFIQNIDNVVISRPILIQSHDQNKKKNARKRRWWFF
ncbi:hypothetical protein Ancab_004295 [Ancistrocladus abbreviatus]